MIFEPLFSRKIPVLEGQFLNHLIFCLLNIQMKVWGLYHTIDKFYFLSNFCFIKWLFKVISWELLVPDVYDPCIALNCSFFYPFDAWSILCAFRCSDRLAHAKMMSPLRHLQMLEDASMSIVKNLWASLLHTTLHSRISHSSNY